MRPVVGGYGLAGGRQRRMSVGVSRASGRLGLTDVGLSDVARTRGCQLPGGSYHLARLSCAASGNDEPFPCGGPTVPPETNCKTVAVSGVAGGDPDGLGGGVSQ